MSASSLAFLAALLLCALPLVVIAGLVLVAVFSKRGRDARAIAIATRTPIADVKHGELVKIIGAARAHERTLRAPVSGRECVVHEVTIGCRRPGSDGHLPASFPTATSFTVEDDTGAARVVTDSLSLLLEKDHEAEVEVAQAEGWMFDLLEKSGLTLLRDGTGPGVIELSEAVVEVGEEVAVLGRAERDASGALTLRPDPEGGLRISDERETYAD